MELDVGRIDHAIIYIKLSLVNRKVPMELQLIQDKCQT